MVASGGCSCTTILVSRPARGGVARLGSGRLRAIMEGQGGDWRGEGGGEQWRGMRGKRRLEGEGAMRRGAQWRSAGGEPDGGRGTKKGRQEVRGGEAGLW